MKINDDHFYHGAALAQITEHPSYKAQNLFRHNGRNSISAYRINDDIGIYVKYARSPVGNAEEFVFNFSSAHRKELELLASKCHKLFVVLVCVQAREIGVIRYDQFTNLLKTREAALGRNEDQLQVLVSVPKGKSLRVYVNRPGTKGRIMGRMVVKRRDFPSVIFENRDT